MKLRWPHRTIAVRTWTASQGQLRCLCQCLKHPLATGCHELWAKAAYVSLSQTPLRRHVQPCLEFGKRPQAELVPIWNTVYHPGGGTEPRAKHTGSCRLPWLSLIVLAIHPVTDTHLVHLPGFLVQVKGRSRVREHFYFPSLQVQCLFRDAPVPTASPLSRLREQAQRPSWVPTPVR